MDGDWRTCLRGIPLEPPGSWYSPRDSVGTRSSGLGRRVSVGTRSSGLGRDSVVGTRSGLGRRDSVGTRSSELGRDSVVRTPVVGTRSGLGRPGDSVGTRDSATVSAAVSIGRSVDRLGRSGFMSHVSSHERLHVSASVLAAAFGAGPGALEETRAPAELISILTPSCDNPPDFCSDFTPCY
jgi:hypothetical protein